MRALPPAQAAVAKAAVAQHAGEQPARVLVLALLAGAMVVLAAMSTATELIASHNAPFPLQAVTFGADAKVWCTEHGGMVVERRATSTGAARQGGAALPDRLALCEFQSDRDGVPGRIAVDLVTLYDTQPTLAAVAYLRPAAATTASRAKVDGTSMCPAALSDNPGGGDTGVVGDTGGEIRWLAPGDLGFPVLRLCVFPDGSAIGARELLDRAGSTAASLDLRAVLRYRAADSLPAVLGP